KPEWSAARTIAEIRRGAGSQFDPRVVEAFLTIHMDTVDTSKTAASTIHNIESLRRGGFVGEEPLAAMDEDNLGRHLKQGTPVARRVRKATGLHRSQPGCRRKSCDSSASLTSVEGCLPADDGGIKCRSQICESCESLRDWPCCRRSQCSRSRHRQLNRTSKGR